MPVACGRAGALPARMPAQRQSQVTGGESRAIARRMAPIRRSRQKRLGTMAMHMRLMVTAIGGIALAAALATPAPAQKAGGILRIYHRDSPASMSVHEEGTIGVIMPMMGVFNNLVVFDQNVPQNSDASIVPDLATGWTWNADHTALTFKLRDGIKWHDGKAFSAADEKCTFDLLTNQEKEKLRLISGKCWW